jgi:hypothetical protein
MSFPKFSGKERHAMEHPNSEPKEARQPYETPAVVYEAALEVRAGSPLGVPPLLGLTDPAGLE